MSNIKEYNFDMNKDFLFISYPTNKYSNKDLNESLELVKNTFFNKDKKNSMLLVPDIFTISIIHPKENN